LAGNTLFTQPALAKFWKDKIGQEITLLDIYTIARSITEHYQAEGYVLAAAQVPQQKISAGLAKIEIEEGLVSEITVHDVGGKFLKTESARLKSALQNKPLQIKQLEQYLLQDHPGTIARAYFKPTEQKGSTALSVILTRTPPPSPRGVGL
jgi:hemolysin activation/secretion protein